MWEFFIKNDKFAYLFIVALLGVGLYSLVAIPKESAPEVVIPIGVITTVLPGAPAADIESLLTNEIERGLSGLQNVKKITSTSREGVSNVVVEYEADADLDKSIADLKDEVDKIKQNLPEDAEDPVVSEVNFVDQPILTVAVAGTLSDFALTELAKKVETEIESVPGVSKVEVSGARDREVTVIINQESLERYDVSIIDAINAIRNANISFPIGQIINDGISYNVAFEGDIAAGTEIKNVSVVSKNGQPVYIRDIATVEDGLAAQKSLSRLSVAGKTSQNAVAFNIYKQSGGDITTITSAVNERFEELKVNNGLLSGLETVVVLDAGRDIKKDLINLSTSGLQTILLVVILLVLTIGWREGLLAGTAIPLSFLFGFIGLYLSGNTINFLSLFALILGIGILVDSAIVMVEGINRKIKDNPNIDNKQAAIETIREFSAPLISGTLTTVAMFVGLFIVSGVTGQFIASIPFTLIFLLLASMFVALAILPLLAAVVLKRSSTSKLEALQVLYAQKLETWYQGKLTPYITDEAKQDRFLAGIFAALIFSIFLPINVFAGLIASPLVYLITLKFYKIQKEKKLSNFKLNLRLFPSVIVTIVVSVMVANTILPSLSLVRVIFFDQSDVDYLIVEVEEPEGTTKTVTDIAIRRVEEILYSEPSIDSFSVTVGSGSQFGSGGTGEKYANIFVNLSKDRELTSSELVTSLRERMSVLNDLKVTVNQPSDGPPTGSAIIVKFLGDDLSVLTELANESAKIFRAEPGIVNVETSTNNNSTEFVLELDKEKAAALGLNSFVVSQVARAALFGTEATSLTTLDEDIKVVVKLNVSNNPDVVSETSNIASINALNEIAIPTQTGSVPLSSLVSVLLRESSSAISHEEGKRVVVVEADVAEGQNARELQTQVLAKIQASLDVPADIEISTGGGETDESNKAFIEMFLALVVGIVLMVAIITLQFNSFLHTKYVISILPYSLIGIMFGLAISQNTLSFPSMMGFIALSGIVVNNSILLIDVMNQMRKADPSADINQIVIVAASSRLRAILLTSITTVIGMIPLTYAGDLWSPLAYAVMFGLIFSVIITLILIPITYSRNPGEINN